jgi:hypothetical protein
MPGDRAVASAIAGMAGPVMSRPTPPRRAAVDDVSGSRSGFVMTSTLSCSLPSGSPKPTGCAAATEAFHGGGAHVRLCHTHDLSGGSYTKLTHEEWVNFGR